MMELKGGISTRPACVGVASSTAVSSGFSQGWFLNSSVVARFVESFTRHRNIKSKTPES